MVVAIVAFVVALVVVAAVVAALGRQLLALKDPLPFFSLPIPLPFVSKSD